MIIYANTNISKLNISVISMVIFLVHQDQNRYNNSNEHYSNNYYQAYTYSYITHLTQHTQPRHFIEFPVLLLQSLAFETLLP